MDELLISYVCNRVFLTEIIGYKKKRDLYEKFLELFNKPRTYYQNGRYIYS